MSKITNDGLTRSGTVGIQWKKCDMESRWNCRLKVYLSVVAFCDSCRRQKKAQSWFLRWVSAFLQRDAYSYIHSGECAVTRSWCAANLEYLEYLGFLWTWKT